MKLTNEQINRIEGVWKARCTNHGYTQKRPTKRELDAQAEFFCGAMAVVASLMPPGSIDTDGTMPPRWFLTVMGGRRMQELEPLNEEAQSE